MRERGDGGAGHGQDMTAKCFVILAALGLVGLACIVPSGAATAQSPYAQPQHARTGDVTTRRVRRYARPRIEINRGGRLLYRQCNGGYELQYRPIGTVLFPYQHCWWARG
jgi:hypothetical protein